VATAHLGEFGKQARTLVDADFTYFGTTIRVNPQLSPGGIIEFFERAGKIQMPDPELPPEEQARAGDGDSAGAARVPGLPGPPRRPRSCSSTWPARTARQLDDLMEVSNAIMTLVGGRPTQRSSDSSPGPRRRKAGASSSQQVKTRLERQGRPDLALMVLEVQEGREAEAAAASA
jgi:hypothetical protein